MDVIDPEISAGILQVSGQPETDITDALNGYLQTVEVVPPKFVFYRCFEADKGAVGCRR